MPSFLSQRERTVSLTFKVNTDGDQVVDAFARLSDDTSNDVFIALIVPRGEGVLHVGFHAVRVGFVKDGCDTALGPIG